MARHDEDTGPVRGPLLQKGTLSRGAIAGGIVLLVLGGIAWMRSERTAGFTRSMPTAAWG